MELSSFRKEEFDICVGEARAYERRGGFLVRQMTSYPESVHDGAEEKHEEKSALEPFQRSTLYIMGKQPLMQIHFSGTLG
jgi:hypothetical protein